MLDDDRTGHRTQTDYLPYYFRELNPVRASFSLLLSGYAGLPPGPCCELGFGQGMSLAIHAAAGVDRQWWGTDFNATHAGHAAQLLRLAGVDGVAEAQSFAEYCRRDDLPQFAFVGLHGVWSWISPENRALIADFLRRKLLPGGVAYVSYNAAPGWAAMQPVRQVLIGHARWMGAPGQSEIDRARAAVGFMHRLAALDPSFTRDNPTLLRRIAELADRSPEYLVHEYFVPDWHPLSFAETEAILQPAGLDFACDADPHERLPGLQIRAEFDGLLDEIEHLGLRETVRDLILERRFRGDFWIKEGRRLPPQELLPLLDEMPLVLGTATSAQALVLEGPAGSLTLDAEPLAAMMEVLREGQGQVALGQLIDAAAECDVEVEGALAMVLALVGAKVLEPAQSAEQARRARPATARFNDYMLRQRRERASVTYLASPVTGGAIELPAHLHDFLAAYLDGLATPPQWAGRVLDRLGASGGRVTREGRPVENRDEALEVLLQFAQQLDSIWLPALRRLQIVD